MNIDNRKLFDLYIRPEMRFIHNVCWKFCCDKSRCEEYYNEILTTLFLRMHTYNPERNLHAWLYVIIKREIVRKQIGQNKIDGRIKYTDLEQPYYQNISSVQETSVRNYDDFYLAISHLDPIPKRIIEMRMQGYKVKDISHQLFQDGMLNSESSDIVKYNIRKTYH